MKIIVIKYIKNGRHLDGRLYSEMPEILTKGSPQLAFVP